MKIQGAESGDFISIDRRDREDAGYHYSVFSITGSLRGQQVTNDSVMLLDSDGFPRLLTAFEKTRKGSCTLSGTEDFSLYIDADGRSGAAWLEFTVARIHILVSGRTGAGR